MSHHRRTFLREVALTLASVCVLVLVDRKGLEKLTSTKRFWAEVIIIIIIIINDYHCCVIKLGFSY